MVSWKKQVAVISGEGVRNYYRKQGYKCEDSYESKNLRIFIIICIFS